MLFEGIIITGTSCAGKSTISQKLCKESMTDGTQFELVKAVTTRKKRADDTNFEFIDDTEFDNLLKETKLLLNTTYRNKKYGIKESDYNDVIQRKKVPILVITPASAIELLNQKSCMCIFLDAEDEILIERREKRSGTESDKITKKEFDKQNNEDRKFQNSAHYIINNSDSSASVSLIVSLWNSQNQSGALSQELIKKMLDCGILLRNTDLKMIKGASYDLRLGDEYYYEGKIQKLSEENPFLTIEPYDYAIVSCKEMAWMPRDVIAKFGLTVRLFCQGVILSNGPQVDPGFRGKLFCLLFNTSNRAVHLKRGNHYATIEFNKLIGCAEPYEGQYQDKKNIIDYIPENALHGAINELKKEIVQLKKESRIMQNIYLGVVALMFTIITIWSSSK